MGLAVDWLKRGNACLTRVQSIMSQDSESDEVDLVNLNTINKIEFKNVSFNNSNKKILNNISFILKRFLYGNYWQNSIW